MIAFLEGYGIGFGTIIFIGPVLFLIVNSTLLYGSKAGIAASLGIFVSDVLFALICYYGTSLILHDLQYQKAFGYAGAIILLGLGISYLLKSKANNNPNKEPINIKKLSGIFTKGFVINFINPFSLALWVGFVQYGKGRYTAPHLLITYMSAIVLGIFTIDLLKVFFAHKIKALLSGNRLQYVFKILGIVLIGFGSYTLFYVMIKM